MSRPRFLADHDLNEHIIDGVLRREPAVEFIRVLAANLVVSQPAGKSSQFVGLWKRGVAPRFRFG